MKVLVRIDQSSAIAKGLDAPSSTSKLEFNPSSLTATQREIASNLFTAHKDNWSQAVTVISPTLEYLAQALDGIEAERQAETKTLQEKQAQQDVFNAKVKENAVSLVRMAIRKDKSILHFGQANVNGFNFFNKEILVEYTGHYIQLATGQHPGGTHPEPFDMRCITLDGDPDPMDSACYETDVQAAFASWQKALDIANNKARSKAEADLKTEIQKSENRANEFIQKHGNSHTKLRFKEFGLTRNLVTRAIEDFLRTDYPAFDVVDKDTGHAIPLSALRDAELRIALNFRDTKLKSGDALGALEIDGKHYLTITRVWEEVSGRVVAKPDVFKPSKKETKTHK